MINLFDYSGGKVLPSEHCYNISWLKNIMDEYKKGKEYLKVYAYIHYMTYPYPDKNPFFNISDSEKGAKVYKDIDAEFSLDCEVVEDAIKNLNAYYETPTTRAYNGIKTMLDKLAEYMSTREITEGRDGNFGHMLRSAKDFAAIRESFKKVQDDLIEEQDRHARGGKEVPYDL